MQRKSISSGHTANVIGLMITAAEVPTCQPSELQQCPPALLTTGRALPPQGVAVVKHAVQHRVVDFGAVGLGLEEALHGLLRRVCRPQLVLWPGPCARTQGPPPLALGFLTWLAACALPSIPLPLAGPSSIASYGLRRIGHIEQRGQCASSATAVGTQEAGNISMHSAGYGEPCRGGMRCQVTRDALSLGPAGVALAAC